MCDFDDGHSMESVDGGLDGPVRLVVQGRRRVVTIRHARSAAVTAARVLAGLYAELVLKSTIKLQEKAILKNDRKDNATAFAL